ncbi:Peptidase family M48 [Cohaesibacter sp. ES.047]|uniref:M48 family metalloprotease n=1 Tax=Cohaesibacter sp. ES.047 TaxID=1798205 RepID=UPI000BB967B2|nr:M48 family metalloprotease [Cohaesibacter sp. ES.047]SNY90900.1 Peptidase family M48 [Cohaesibacter sp. ES.047]
MKKELQSGETLSHQVRSHMLRGGNLWSVIAFSMLGLATAVFLILTILHGFDMVIGFGEFLPVFNKLVYSNPSLLLGWFPEIVDLFEAARGQVYLDPVAWMVLASLGLLLFFAHFFRFSHPRGRSLAEDEKAGAVVRRLLAEVGYFRTISELKNTDEVAYLDFLSKGRVLFAPSGQVNRIVKGKPSENQQKILRFFMVHEFAHALMKDNLVNSAFVVIVSIYVFVVLSIFSPLLLISASLLSMGPFGLWLKLVLQILTIGCFSIGIAMSFHGVLVSYNKVREFFADQAAFRFAGDAFDPHSVGDDPERPDMLSAVSPNITPFERQLHQQGYSLHGRNLLLFFWGLVIAIRTLYVLLAPKDLCLWVLGFDAVALVSFAILYVTLPKRPPKSEPRPLLPWVLTLFGVLAVEVCGPALAGVLKSFYWDFFSNTNAQLIGLPGAMASLGLLVGCLIMVGKRLLSGRTPRRKWSAALGKRLGLRLLMLPGVAIEYVLIFALIGAFDTAYLRYFFKLEFLHEPWQQAALAIPYCAAGLVLLYNQYKGLFVFSRYRTALVTLVEVVVFFLLSFGLQLSAQELIAASERGEAMALPSLAHIIAMAQGADLSAPLQVAVASSSFYLLLRCLCFWAWHKLYWIERNQRQGRKS